MDRLPPVWSADGCSRSGERVGGCSGLPERRLVDGHLPGCHADAQRAHHQSAGRLDAPGRSLAASERVFDVLARAGVERVLVDNSSGAIAEDLAPWDGDVIDLSGTVPQVIPPGLTRFRDPLCPRLARAVAAAVEANWPRYRATAGAGVPQAQAGRRLA